MSSRERTLAIVLMGLILLAAGGAGGYFLVYQPLQQKRAAADKLAKDVADLQGKVDQVKIALPRVNQVRRQSLPADPYLARREYSEMMSRLLQQARIPLGYKVQEIVKPNDVTGNPPLLPGGGKKPAYTKVAFDITFEKADMWALHDFLVGYYKLNLLHQITAFEVKLDDNNPAAGRTRLSTDRKNLAVKLTTEAIILDGAEPRRTLLPVPTAFAAVGGLSGYHAITPELARGITPVQHTPVLAARGRDYTYIVQNDVFHGPLPPPDPFRLDKIADVAVDLEKEISPVKVPIKGDPAQFGGVKITATGDGKFLAGDAVEVDQTARTITITPPEGETGTGTVTVVVTPEHGTEQKATFTVTVKEAVTKEPEKKLPDIADAIRLVITAARSDGTASAVIRDNFNPHTYEIEVSTTGRVRVTKYEFFGANKKRDKFYEPVDQLVISDDGISSTKRTFKVVAIDDTGLVLADLKPEANKLAPKGPPAGPGRFPGPGKFPAPPGPRSAQGPADPLAVAAGAAVVAGQPPQPVLYRWGTGKSLKLLTEVPKGEAQKILQRAAESGPVGADEVAAGN